MMISPFFLLGILISCRLDPELDELNTIKCQSSIINYDTALLTYKRRREYLREFLKNFGRRELRLLMLE